MAVVVREGLVICQARWEGPSGLPEDVFTSTWYFRRNTAGPVTPLDQDNAFVAVENFWSFDSGGGTPIAGYVPGRLGDLKAKTYDAGQEPPREPTEHVSTTVSASGGDAMPPEVALCLSYYADRNVPTRRGRVYLGPWTVGANVSAAPGPLSRPRAALIDDIVGAAEELASGASASGLTWVMYSPKDQTIRDLNAGWVDNAWDTQRRRGVQASTRNPWPAP